MHWCMHKQLVNYKSFYYERPAICTKIKCVQTVKKICLTPNANDKLKLCEFINYADLYFQGRQKWDTAAAPLTQ